MSLADQTFLLTGCASGIGRHLASCLNKQGARVFATDIDFDTLQQEGATLGWNTDRIQVRLLDVRDPAQWERIVAEVVQRWGRLDVLINIAGVSLNAAIHQASVERINLHIDVNTKGTLFGCRFASAQMVEQGGGHIINFASLSSFVPTPYMSLYNASKFAVRGFSHAIAEELAPHKVYVSAVCPDAIDTPMLQHEALEPDAALNFAGSRIYTVEDIERLIFRRVLPRRPREVLLAGFLTPLTRLIVAYPGITRPLIPIFRRKGAKRQQAYRNSLKK
jgi:3-oxoacyl-[acyl-carrier protein] reductase